MPQYISVDDKLNREKQSGKIMKVPVVQLECHDEPQCKNEVFGES